MISISKWKISSQTTADSLSKADGAAYEFGWPIFLLSGLISQSPDYKIEAAHSFSSYIQIDLEIPIFFSHRKESGFQPNNQGEVRAILKPCTTTTSA